MIRLRKRVRTPTVLQFEATECGAAALASVLAYHGLRIPLEELRHECGVSRDGSKASNVLKAARKYGMEARAFKKEPIQLPELPLPAIIFWNFNHFVVLEEIGSKGAWVNDPAFGRRRVGLEEFDESFTGVVLTFVPGEAFRPGGERRSALRGLLGRLDGTGSALWFAMLASLGLIVPGLAVPAFISIFVDEVLIRKLDSWMWPLVMVMLGMAAISSALVLLQQHNLARFRTYLALKESVRFIWHVLRLPVEYFAQRYAIEVAGRTTLNDRLATLLGGDLATSALNALVIVLYVMVMVQYDLVLTGIGVAFALGNLVMLWLVAHYRVDLSRRRQMDSGLLRAATVRGFAMLDTIKATGTESLFLARWCGYHAKLLNADQELGRMNVLLAAVPFGLGAASTVMVIIIGGERVMQGAISIGMLLGFQALLALASRPVNQLVNFGGQLQEMRASLERLDDVLRQALDPSFGPAAEPSEPIPARLIGALQVDSISYGYSPLDPPLIDEFTLRLQPGARVALVGRSGSGKSTIGRVIVGLYHPWSGVIRLDGYGYDEIPRETLHHSVAYVDQNTTLFPGTIRDNIALWDPTLSDERLIAAAQDALIYSDITARPLGFDHAVEEAGRDFSGGQRQRMILARALAIEPSLLGLDEATSALDAVTEFHIMENIRRRGCSCIVIAHRLSTVRNCDEIIVLEQGCVVERGPHGVLMKQKGPYRSLIEA